eukprot:9484286-Pyramimonas_sp.AAC.1
MKLIGQVTTEYHAMPDDDNDDVTTYWACPRCKHGKQTTEPHSRIQGQCKMVGATPRPAPPTPSAAAAPAAVERAAQAEESEDEPPVAMPEEPPDEAEPEVKPLQEVALEPVTTSNVDQAPAIAPEKSASASASPSASVEPRIAKKEWYDVKPSFNLANLLKKLKEAEANKDRKECIRCLLGLH